MVISMRTSAAVVADSSQQHGVIAGWAKLPELLFHSSERATSRLTKPSLPHVAHAFRVLVCQSGSCRILADPPASLPSRCARYITYRMSDALSRALTQSLCDPQRRCVSRILRPGWLPHVETEKSLNGPSPLACRIRNEGGQSQIVSEVTPDQLEHHTETLDLINTEVSASLARQFDAGSSIDTKAAILVGYAAAASSFLATRRAQTHPCPTGIRRLWHGGGLWTLGLRSPPVPGCPGPAATVQRILYTSEGPGAGCRRSDARSGVRE